MILSTFRYEPVLSSANPCIGTIFYDTIHYSLFTVGGGKG